MSTSKYAISNFLESLRTEYESLAPTLSDEHEQMIIQKIRDIASILQCAETQGIKPCSTATHEVNRE